ncbi:MAG: lipoate-protein ligase B [Brevundimonas sp.]|uniref:Octanoyltransferase n=1 Tax=Brevundimonas albigilva TaxID=1312364 RepID=A0ABY4SR49_9CAUL|nr:MULTISPECIES: lipoyl(octanoyl) transferase LipB [Brevundimonas]PZU56698.1 MAG: lipoate-protein ligase B [Brevundimonas sp.]UQV18806.1 lipoyl(octanoyl) transferase LipB [Brevundimonas albigilva]URI16399.1 lipoyl(octanoyl) transferase LipB [Brevundimonas albigilva]
MLAEPLSPPSRTLFRDDDRPVEWAVSAAPVDYAAAEAFMEARVAAIAAGEAAEMVWLLEHPPLYTAGVSARDEDLLDAGRFPVHRTGRGGQFTYHGPGQRVAYVMLDLGRRGRDVRAFVRGLEGWLIEALAAFGVPAGVRDGRVGVWVERKGAGWAREDKIAAIGVKVRKWVTFHGVSLNVEPDLSHFGGIVPCGIQEHGVTSLVDLGVLAAMDEADGALHDSFRRLFGPTTPATPPL